jgi:hypothetical protein
MKHLKYRWDECRGDTYDDWGRSWWYFEIGPDGYMVRQIEVYDSEVRLRYGPDHAEDEFGFLGYVHETDLDRSAYQLLSAAEFEAEWATGPWHNLDAKRGAAN